MVTYDMAQPAALTLPARIGRDERLSGDPVRRLAALIEHPDTETVEQLCDAMGMSHARLLRFCHNELGCSPKKLIRRARFVRMLRVMHETPYAEWRHFLDPRYVDQSHFIRDFKHFLGMTPTAFERLSDALRLAFTDRVAAPLMV